MAVLLLVVFFLLPPFLAPFLAVFDLFVFLAAGLAAAAPSAALGALFLIALDLEADLFPPFVAFLATLPFAI